MSKYPTRYYLDEGESKANKVTIIKLLKVLLLKNIYISNYCDTQSHLLIMFNNTIKI